MVELSPDISGYFGAFRDAFGGLSAVAQTESESRLKTSLLYKELTKQLKRLEHSFACWHLKCHFSDSFKVDRSESGFPPFKAVLELQQDAARHEERLADIPEQAIDQEEPSL